jgi:hypothetical protein
MNGQQDGEKIKCPKCGHWYYQIMKREYGGGPSIFVQCMAFGCAWSTGQYETLEGAMEEFRTGRKPQTRWQRIKSIFSPPQ